MPNALLFKGEIHNLTHLRTKKVKVVIDTPREFDVEVARTALLAAARTAHAWAQDNDQNARSALQGDLISSPRTRLRRDTNMSGSGVSDVLLQGLGLTKNTPLQDRGQRELPPPSVYLQKMESNKVEWWVIV